MNKQQEEEIQKTLEYNRSNLSIINQYLQPIFLNNLIYKIFNLLDELVSPIILSISLFLSILFHITNTSISLVIGFTPNINITIFVFLFLLLLLTIINKIRLRIM